MRTHSVALYMRDFYHLIVQCASCPEPAICARLLEEKWRQAYQAVFRFGEYYVDIDACCSLTWRIVRPLSTIHGFPLSAHIGGRQSATVPDPPQLPNDCEGVHCYA